MDYGAIAGSLQGLYGGIKTGMDIYNTIQDRKMAEKQYGLQARAAQREEAKAARESEMFEYGKPGLEATKIQSAEALKYLNQNKTLQEKLDSLNKLTANDHEYSGNVYKLSKALQEGDPHAIDVLNESGIMQNAVYIPEKNEAGKIIGYAVKGKIGTGDTVQLSPEMLAVYEKSAKSSMEAIYEQQEKLKKQIGENQMRANDLLGGKETSAERRETSERTYLGHLATLKRQQSADAEKERHNNITEQLEMLNLKLEEQKAQGAINKEKASAINGELAAASKNAGDSEKYGQNIANVAKIYFDSGDKDGFDNTLRSYFSSAFGPGYFVKTKGSEGAYSGAKQMLSLALGKVAKNEDVDMVIETLKDNPDLSIPLTPSNLKYLAKGQLPPEEATQEGSSPATHAPIPQAGQGLTNSPMPAVVSRASKTPANPPNVKIINNVPNANGEIEVEVDGVRGFAKAGR